MDGHRAIHFDIVALYKTLSSRKFHFRDDAVSARLPDGAKRLRGIKRDRIVCALANKAANTKHAIITLVDANLVDDAFALCRVLMENAVSLAWMTADDWPIRVDTYALSMAPNLKHVRTLVQEHYPDSEAVAYAADAFADGVLEAISDELFDDEHIKWARFANPARSSRPITYTVPRMLRELDVEHTKPSTGNVAIALWWDGSQYVHSLPLSLKNILRESDSEAWFTIRVRRRVEQSDVAVSVSNIWMLQVLAALNGYLGAGIEAELNALVARGLAATSADEMESSS